VLVTDDAGIREINHAWLGKDRPTNVISFAMQEGAGAGVQPDLLGDVVISADTAARDAAEAGAPVEHELCFLLLHGILHLLGYDHERVRPPRPAAWRRGTGAVRPGARGVSAGVSQLPERPQGFIASLNCAIEGVLWAARTQRHMLVHLLAAVAVLLTALVLRLTLVEFALLALAIILVLFAELMNTALRWWSTWFPRVPSVGAACQGCGRRCRPGGEHRVHDHGLPGPGALSLPPVNRGRQQLSAVHRQPGDGGRVLVVLMVVLLKARVGRGTPLHGGCRVAMPALPARSPPRWLPRAGAAGAAAGLAAGAAGGQEPGAARRPQLSGSPGGCVCSGPA